MFRASQPTIAGYEGCWLIVCKTASIPTDWQLETANLQQVTYPAISPKPYRHESGNNI